MTQETDVVVPDGEPPRAERPRWLTVTAGALGVALLAGGLFGAQAVLGRDGGGDARAEAGGEGTVEPGSPELPEPGREAGDWPGPWDGAPLPAAGPLPEGPGSAEVYGFGAGTGEARVAGLAALLGVEGEPRLDEGSWWSVAGPDADGPSLSVTEETGRWYYQSGPYDLYTQEMPYDPDEAVSSDGAPAEPAEPALSEEEALAAAAGLVEALGLADAPVESVEFGDGNRTLVFPREVDGLRAYGLETEIAVGPEGSVVTASGALSDPEVVGEQDMLGAQELLDQRNAELPPVQELPRMEPDPADCPMLEPEVLPETMPESYPGEMPPVDGDPAGEDTAPVEPVCAMVGEPGVITGPGAVSAEVTGAEQALMQWLWADAGPELLVPAWSYTIVLGDGTETTLQLPAVEYDAAYAQRSGDGAGGTDSGPGTEPAHPDGGGEPGTAGTSVEPYAPGDTTLELTYWTGVCAEYRLVAEESADEVRVLVEEVPGDANEACVMVAQEQTGELGLDSPIGDRTLVDAWGEEIPVS
ncbi:hypothetical protein ACFV5N_20495 [Streptomyces sp. NPDC059853]|uniref:hypothetical protein n=1 Tax=Streptomyces sp. NPDC059853 TaxID=3346973 RepID=UPI003652B326